MKSADLKNKAEFRELIQKATDNNDAEAFADAMDMMFQRIAEDVRAEYEAMQKEDDRAVLAARGVRQLTNEERKYYQKLGEAMQAAEPKQAIQNVGLTLPSTVLTAVFDELQTEHPLLSAINFTFTRGSVEMLLNTNGYQRATWGKLCGSIAQEIMSGFTNVEMDLLKLSAFLPVCKAMLELGPEWLDNYVRQVLYEALANGLEYGIVSGDGNDEPIGMIRQVGENVSVVGGVYPEKESIRVEDFSPETMGALLALLAVDPNGKPRRLRDLIMIVNPQDYYAKIMPATTIMAPDGTFRNDVLPYPVRIIPSEAIETPGTAVLGIGYKYFAGVGMRREGRIEYDDSVNFLEDERVYLIKLYANGFPMDNNAFLVLDVSELQPTTYRVTVVDSAEPAPSTDATLASLSIGNLSLSPAFAAGTATYTAETTNNSNVIRAVQADAKADVSITVGGAAVDNGAAYTWEDGENVVTVTVTAEDGTTTKTYTVTVTKN